MADGRNFVQFSAIELSYLSNKPVFLDKIFLRTDVCDDHSSNDKSPGGTSTRASSQNSRMDSEIKRTMKSAQTGVVRQLKQETRATQLLFGPDLTNLTLK